MYDELVKALLGNIDARDWAKMWLETVKKNPAIPTDEGTMIGWFANAIMTGYDAGYAAHNAAEYTKFLEESKNG